MRRSALSSFNIMIMCVQVSDPSNNDIYTRKLIHNECDAVHD
jgi:hypothetical protein